MNLSLLDLLKKLNILKSGRKGKLHTNVLFSAQRKYVNLSLWIYIQASFLHFWGEYAQQGCSSPSSCLDFMVYCVTCHRSLALPYSSLWAHSFCFCIYYGDKAKYFLFYARLTFSCLLVNPLQPQQRPSRTSAKCWPPPWPLLWLWSRLFWPEHHWGVGGPSDVELYWTQVKYLDVVSTMAIIHHLGWDRVPRQDVNVKKNVWERISVFQTLLVA